MTQKTWIEIQNEPVKAINKLKLDLVASQKIRDDNGLTMLSITGKQQGGKSSYGMLILHDIYNGDVDQIMNHIVFSMEDFTKKISDAINGGYRERCIMWDDASVTGSASTWMVDPEAVMCLAGLGDTLGIATKGLILTSPSGNMTKAFREYPQYGVIIGQGAGKYGRVARGYWMGKSPKKQTYVSLVFEDKYDVRIPFYERYAEKRKEISIQAVKNMVSMLEKRNEEEAHPKQMSIKDRVGELRRDMNAGVFGDMTFKDVCKANKINYSTARNYV